MNKRVSNAFRTALKVGAWAALLGFFTNLFGLPEPDSSWSRPVRVVIGTVGGFALFFVLVFPLVLAFPPATNARGELYFPGARKAVWGLVALATAWVIYFVWARS